MIGQAERRIITPQESGIVLGGNAGGRVSRGVDSDLEVNVLCLADGGALAVLVSLDALYVTADLRASVLRGVAPLGVQDADLFLCASHTHYAPALDVSKPLLGRPNQTYQEYVARQTIACIEDCLHSMASEVRVSLTRSHLNIGVNRRLKRRLKLSKNGLTVNKMVMAPNPEGTTDPVVDLVQVVSGEEVLACIWAASCHPTGLPDPHYVSADWPGRVRDGLRTALSVESLPVLFLQGFSGDVRPPSGHGRTDLLGRLRRVIQGAAFLPMSWEEYSSWSESVTSQVVGLLETRAISTASSGLERVRTTVPATNFLSSGGGDLPPVSFHRIRIGTLEVVGASAELVSSYAPALRDLASDAQVIPVGCIDHVIGYWPTKQMMTEGGYEVAGHCIYFGIQGCSPDLEEQVWVNFRNLFVTRT